MSGCLSLFLGILLAACNLPRPGEAAAPPATDTPVSQPCYFNWATHSLPDLSRQVQAAMDRAGLQGLTASAEAFGEDCIDPQTNQPVGFGAMETDFRVAMPVADLADLETLGNQLERILVVLDQFSSDATASPHAGYVDIRFEAGDQELNLWFLLADGQAARGKGLRGQELLKQFLTK